MKLLLVSMGFSGELNCQAGPDAAQMEGCGYKEFVGKGLQLVFAAVRPCR